MANATAGFARTFRAFRYRDFRLMWFGACASTIGTFVQQFAQSWLVYDLTKDPFYLGLDLFLGQLPIMMFSLFGGVFADRMDRRKLLLASQYIQMTCAFLLALLFAFHVVKVWHILALSFVVGLGQSFGGPAYSSLLPTLVGPEDLSNAIAMNSIQFNLARIIGPTLGGLTYTTLGATWCFTLNGFSYLAVIASLFLIQVKFVPAKTTDSVLSSMKEGIRFIRQRDGMSALVVLAFCTTLFGFSLNGFIPVFVRDVFHKGPETYTLLLVCSGGGSICGALAVATSERLKGQGRLTLLILALLGLITAGFAVSRWLPASCTLMFFAGAAVMASASFMLSLAQLISTDAMRGRVMSVYNLAFRAGIPLGALGLGKLIPMFGVSKSLSGAGIALTTLSLYFLVSRKETFRSSRSVRL
ncbi:MFS transporter [Tunturiibacter gelidoferens]|jgi:predicted MFS family arabinose efflux permease|uniref:MFS family arabinose efflux permease n=1 Tax=Tunturiibacter gelidiferens TaxID=3069689 RepID=A0A9X0QEA6_9BACT|nr:MFS transporter [Edaphobacter lichenicola]MBB5328811.1 putative MFS family arabinose efflux permease [Edaphobacter lichenicola]